MVYRTKNYTYCFARNVTLNQELILKYGMELKIK